MAQPELFPQFGMQLKDFPGGDPFKKFSDFGGGIKGRGRDKQVDMVGRASVNSPNVAVLPLTETIVSLGRVAAASY